MTGSFTVVCGSTVSSTNPRKTYDSRGRSFHRVYRAESGRYHLVRFVRGEGKLNVFGEMFPAPPEAIYEYVQLTIDVERQRLGVFLDDKQIDEHQYVLRK